jgi:hypothetical protein
MKAVTRSRSSDDAPAAPTLLARYYLIRSDSMVHRVTYFKDLPSLVNVSRELGQESRHERFHRRIGRYP